MSVKLVEYENNDGCLVINGEKIPLTDEEINQAWCQAAILFDTDHYGPALIELGSRVIQLDEDQWGELYRATDAHTERHFLDIDFDEETYH